MIAAEIIGQVVAAGCRIAVDGADLVLTADRPLPADLLDRLKAHKPDILAALVVDEALAAACKGVKGITAAELRSLLSPEDIADIEAGGILAVPTLRAYAHSFAEGIRSGRITVLSGRTP